MPGPVAIEKLSSLAYKLHQPIAQQQKSCLKDTTHFINFLGKTAKVRENTILVSVDIMSLYTNIPQEERINLVCKHTKHFTEMNVLSTNVYFKSAQTYLSGEPSIYCRKLPTNTMNTWNCHEHQLKMVVTFASVFMVKVEREIL